MQRQPNRRSLSPSSEGRSTFARSAVAALDRDASMTVELHFQPPSTTAQPTEWLLLHTLPVTAGLATVVARLLEAQGTAQDHPPSSPSTDKTDAAGASTPTHAAVSSSAAAALPIVQFARVGYVVSEIHAYCLLVKCSTAAGAAALKATMERGAALGVAAPLEFVLDEPVVLRLRTNTSRVMDDGDEQQQQQSMRAMGAASPLPTSPGMTATDRRVSLVRAALHGLEGGYPALVASLSNTLSGHATAAGVSRNSEDAVSPLLAPSSATTTTQRVGGIPSPSGNVVGGTPLGQNGGIGAGAPAPPSPYVLAAAALGNAPPLTPALTPAHAAVTPGSGSGGGGSDDHCAICQVEPNVSHPCLVTLCHHVFHLSCYAKLPSAECPLCRFSLYSLLSDVRCERCGTYEDLWACLICGYVGCGRGRRNHARAHYDETGHSCTLQSSTSRIWNESSRMFLNQEVALVLGELDDTAVAAAGGSAAVAKAASDRLWLMTRTEADAHDAALQAALNESREEAVQQYYAAALHAMAAEQRAWYEQQSRALREAVAQRAGHAAATASGKARTDGTGSVPNASRKETGAAALADLVRKEQAARRAIVTAYLEGVRQHVTHAAARMRAVVSRERERRDALQERVLLQSHENKGRQGRIALLRQRVTEAAAKGNKDREAKTALQAELERQVSEALSRLAG